MAGEERGGQARAWPVGLALALVVVPLPRSPPPSFATVPPHDPAHAVSPSPCLSCPTPLALCHTRATPHLTRAAPTPALPPSALSMSVVLPPLLLHHAHARDYTQCAAGVLPCCAYAHNCKKISCGRP